MTAGSRRVKRLRVLMSGQEAGWLRQAPNGQVTFTYDDGYAADPASTPLSVGFSLGEPKHSGSRLTAWLTNLLPDNARVLERWAQRYQVSPNSPFALLAHVGADCAGAVQFVPEDRLDKRKEGGRTLLTEQDIAGRLDELAVDPAAWTPQHEGGQFSLAGAQAKFALRLDGDQWSEPWGNEPTTHIIKPPMPGLAHQELNEHLCLRVARVMGLPAAESRARSFVGRGAIVVTRYDRLNANGQVLRVHQEDLCQALGVPPTSKYQSDGGPGPADVIALLRRVMPVDVAAAAVDRFLDALALSWVLGATDAHAKNYSLLLSGPNVRLAPLYDVNSVLPYLTAERRGVPPGRVSMHTARLAMSIGGKALLDEVDGAAWETLASAAKLDGPRLVTRVGEVVDSVVNAVETVVADELSEQQLDSAQRKFAEGFVRAVRRRAGLCRGSLVGRGPAAARRRTRPSTVASTATPSPAAAGASKPS